MALEWKRLCFMADVLRCQTRRARVLTTQSSGICQKIVTELKLSKGQEVVYEQREEVKSCHHHLHLCQKRQRC